MSVLAVAICGAAIGLNIVAGNYPVAALVGALALLNGVLLIWWK